MSRRTEVTKELNAPVDAVWRALTEARSLEQWFPVEARVTPGPNGTIWLSWGDGAEGEGRIFHWEPNQRFGWSEDFGGQRLATDFFLEARGANTVVRVVTSGFSDDAQWDDDFHMLEAGWQYFMAHLQVYLERHDGATRVLVRHRRQTALPKAEAFARLVRALGFVAMPEPDSRVSVTTREGDFLEGRVVALNPGTQLGLQIDNLNHAMLFVEMEGKKAASKPALWLSTYGLPDTTAGEVAVRMRRLYEGALA